MSGLAGEDGPSRLLPPSSARQLSGRPPLSQSNWWSLWSRPRQPAQRHALLVLGQGATLRSAPHIPTRRVRAPTHRAPAIAPMRGKDAPATHTPRPARAPSAPRVRQWRGRKPAPQSPLTARTKNVARRTPPQAKWRGPFASAARHFSRAPVVPGTPPIDEVHIERTWRVFPEHRDAHLAPLTDDARPHARSHTGSNFLGLRCAGCVGAPAPLRAASSRRLTLPIRCGLLHTSVE